MAKRRGERRRKTEVNSGEQPNFIYKVSQQDGKRWRCRKVDLPELSLFPPGPFLAERNCIAPLRKNK
jgi:hypothetical protein